MRFFNICNKIRKITGSQKCICLLVYFSRSMPMVIVFYSFIYFDIFLSACHGYWTFYGFNDLNIYLSTNIFSQKK